MTAPKKLSNSHRWSAAVSDFAANPGRLAPSTVDRVSRHVRRFGREIDKSPYDVRSEDVAGWLDSLNVSRQAGHAYRTSLRTFYRWAYQQGRIHVDPTERDGPHPLARPIPEAWALEIAAFRRWLGAGGRTAETVRTWSSILARLGRQTGTQSPWDLSAEDLADWLEGHRWARETQRSARSVIRTFYRWAQQTGRVDVDPAAALPRVRAATPVPRPATEDDYRAALASASPRVMLMLQLAGEYGLRRGEIARLHTRDVSQDGAGGWWLMVHGKGDKPRRIPLGDDMSIVLRDRPEGYVFPGDYYGHLSPDYVGKITADALPAGVTLHQLRHRFATRAYAISHDVITLQRLLGHSSPATTQRYVQTPDEELRALVAAVSRSTIK